MNDRKHIVITGGGTGGHVAPALAVAEVLQQQGHTLHFIGSTNSVERELVEHHKIQFSAIQTGKLRRYFSLENLVDFFRVGIGLSQAFFLLIKLKADVIFAKGGYVTVPVVYAAKLLNIPVVIHESDAVMGLANRLIAKQAVTICTGFPSVAEAHTTAKTVFTGNPIRSVFIGKLPTIEQTRTHLGLEAKLPTALFMGGSQGAHAINQMVLAMLEAVLPKLQIIHLTGERDSGWATKVKQQLPEALRHRYHPFGFVRDELPAFISLADVVVSRASAGVINELAALGKPTILIPLPSAASDHQRANAKILSDKQAAIVLEEQEIDSHQLRNTIDAVLQNNTLQQQLVDNIRSFYISDAATMIADVIVKAAK
jgi:UDP-N-acetylglucosamine--N-acetylmuramyl-(pentapeptide) pyrophosphoryl-undecaprenol N-acetylglucosamine transferase